jgi:hypothetical protein
MKNYSIEDIDTIIEERGWHSCIANNEPEYGLDTIYIAEDEDQEYFGEFVGEEENGYSFELYTI